MTKRLTCRYAKPLVELVGDETVVSPDVSECISVRSAQQIPNDLDCAICPCWKEKEATDASLC